MDGLFDDVPVSAMRIFSMRRMLTIDDDLAALLEP